MSIPTAIQQVFARVHSPEGLTFPQTVAALLDLGVTRHHVDYAASIATAYKTDSTTHKFEIDVAHVPVPEVHPATKWNGAGLVEAINLVQRGESTYAELSQLCVDASVTGYLAFLTGKRVVYYGSQGEMQVEWFPVAGPRGKIDIERTFIQRPSSVLLMARIGGIHCTSSL